MPSLEYTQVERPFIEQLQGMRFIPSLSWDYLPGDTAVPYLTERENFCQVLLTGRLRAALRRINLGEDGQPWLDRAHPAGAHRITQAVSRLERLGQPKLMAANQVATRLLIQGVQVPGPDPASDKAVTIRYIDFDHPERNDFLAINQFRVDPPWAAGNRGYIVPDIVLFVNGIPLVVVEAQSPDMMDPLTEAIDQLLRYSNQRIDVQEPEGAERLFRYAQLLVATCSETARVGTVGAPHKHYLAWKDTYPVPLEQVASELGVETLSQQQTLIAGALHPVHLLDIVRNFTLFDQSGGQVKKIMPRYQQFRAVHKTIERLHAVHVGFTGTPILEQDKQPTHEIFGPFIDTYTLTQSQADGATVPILYEGRDVEGAVVNGETLDAVFEEVLGGTYTEGELEEIREQYATHRKVLEAQGLIAGKARDMLRHYVTRVMPGGFKAQVVAVSRRAAVRYQAALVEAQRALAAELETAQARGETMWEQLAIEKTLPRLRRLRFAAVISGDHNDPPDWGRWTRQGQQDADVEDFKKGFDPQRGEGYTAMLAVCSMLLTGFDAPREQALYIDRPMVGYELLQAIARVNRTFPGKERGLVLDYFGLGGHLQQALEIYTRNDVRGGLRPIEDELPLLRDRHRRVVSLFTENGCALADADACVELLRDARLRARFAIAMREFLETFNVLMHRPEALPYVEDAKRLGLIRAKAGKRYRDQHLEIAGAEAKVRQLIDAYVVAQGVDPRIPPIDILDAEFEAHVARVRSPRAQAAEMAFAARHHIRQHYQEDPVYYQKLSERLEEILQTFADNWEAQVEALRDLIRNYRETQAETDREDRAVRPFLRLLVDANAKAKAADGPSAPMERQALAAAAVALVDRIRREIGRVDFWRKDVAQERLRADILRYLDDHDLAPFDQQSTLADQLLDTARANHTLLTEG